MPDEPAVVDAVAAGTAKLFQASTLTAAWGLVVPVTVTVLELTLALFAGDVMVPVSFGRRDDHGHLQLAPQHRVRADQYQQRPTLLPGRTC